jgi:hypothetical protein
MMKSKTKNQLWAARFEPADAQRIEAVARRLDLKIADVIRRATLVGLSAFNDAKLPGAFRDQERRDD